MREKICIKCFLRNIKNIDGSFDLGFCLLPWLMEFSLPPFSLCLSIVVFFLATEEVKRREEGNAISSFGSTIANFFNI